MRHLPPQIIFLLICCAVGFATDSVEKSQSRQLLTAEELGTFGIMRLNDLFDILDSWQAYSLDDYSWSASVWGSPMTQSDPWLLLIDDMRVDNALLGFHSLNMIPLTPGALGSLEITSTPKLVGGNLNQNGMLHLSTLRVPRDLSLKGSFYIGNETGDPGPYRYTDFNSINIDKIGPDLTAVISYGGKKWDLLSDIGFQQYFPTDEKIIGRIQQVAPDSPKIKALTNSLTLRQIAGSWQNEFQWFGALSENYLFFKPALQELRSKYSGVQLQWTLKHKLTGNGQIKLKFNLNRKRLGNQENLPDINFDLDQRSVLLQAEIQRKELYFSNRYGIRIERKFSDSPHLGKPLTTLWGSLFQSLSYPITSSLGQTVDIVVNSGDGKLTANAILTTQFELSKSQRLTSSLAYISHLPGEFDNYPYYVEKGYDLLQQNNWAYTLESPLKNSRKFMAELLWQYQPPGKINLEILLKYGNFHNIYLESQTVHFDSTLFTLTGTTAAISDGHYETVSAIVKLNYQVSANLSTRFFAGYTERISGDMESQVLFSSVPNVKFSTKTQYSNPNQFSMWVEASWQQHTRWPEYQALLSESDGFYKAEIPSQTNIDLALQKTFWHKKLNASLRVSDLLNQKLQSHPAGAVRHLSLFIKIVVKIP